VVTQLEITSSKFGVLKASSAALEAEGTALTLGRYQYHPGGDPKNPPKDAPSALHSVIVPNVNLPKVTRLLIPEVTN